MNKKASFVIPMATFIIIVIGVLIFSAIIMKLTGDILDPISATLGNVTPIAGQEVMNIKNTFFGFWDFIIIIFFLVNIVLLFISAFLIDTHPVFLVLYIISCAFLMMFAPAVIDTVDTIYLNMEQQDSGFSSDIATYTPMTNFIRENFGVIILGIMVLSGLAIYAKIRMFGGGVPSR